MKQQASASEQKRRVYGRPFKPGQSGNLLGRRITSVRFRELFDGFASSYGGPQALSPFQSEMLARAVRMWLRGERSRDVDTQIRLTHLATRLLAAVQHGGANPRRKPPQTPAPTIQDLLAQTEGA